MHRFHWCFIKGEKIHVLPFNWFCLHLITYSHSLCCKMIYIKVWFMFFFWYQKNKIFSIGFYNWNQDCLYMYIFQLVSNIVGFLKMFCLFSIGIIYWYHVVYMITFMLNWYIFQLGIIMFLIYIAYMQGKLNIFSIYIVMLSVCHIKVIDLCLVCSTRVY